MAAPNAPRPTRALAVVAVLLVALVAAMFLRGATAPQLGLDLQGGTSVTLVPRQGSKVTADKLNQAVGIIRQRVDAFGVAESEVTTSGSNNIVISVPGAKKQGLVRSVGQTAQLRFRQVLVAGQPGPANASATPTPSPSPSGSATPGASSSPTGSSSPTRGRALSGALTAGHVPAADSASPTAKPTASPAPTAATGTGSASAASGIPASVQKKYASLDCTKKKNRQGGHDVPSDQYLATCDRKGTSKFILAPAKVEGKNVSGAKATIPQGVGSWEVDLSFDSTGTSAFGNLTRDVYQQQYPRSAVAIVLDGLVVSYPTIQGPITGGQAQITGQFSQSEAQDLANVLKFGALPIAFDLGAVQSISPTLGKDQLNAGLLAGAIGLGLVVLYSIFYYRALAMVVVGSLAVAGLFTYASVSLLSDTIGFRLSLAGVAGLIVAIGITADSFIVFFERLRDEVREGRSLRSGVEYGWRRARRTILSADFVSLLAAVVLYLLSVGSVQGFAFTLGLTTIIDVFIVFLFTKPLVAALSRRKFFGDGHRFSGLDPTRLGVARRAPSETLSGRRRTAREA